ncbi:MAG: leucine-rich repeat domain-containing protein [Bacilli bacterium]|nr:leucine-rich repeat domain-containing protein [Bacilli bacterium]
MGNIEKKEWDIKEKKVRRYLGTSDEITIPDGVESISVFAFENHKRLKKHFHIKKLTIPGTVNQISSSIFSNMLIDELVLKEGVSVIEERSFWGTGIKKLTLPNTIEYIKDGAFCNCNLSELILNEGIKKIGLAQFLCQPNH